MAIEETVEISEIPASRLEKVILGFEEMAVLLQANLKQAGIDMQITAESFPAVQDTYHAGDKHNMAPFFFYFTDITALESLYTCDAVDRFNWSHICREPIDEMIGQLYVIADPDERTQVIRDLQRVLVVEQIHNFI